MSLKPGEITYFVVPDTGVSLPVRKVSYMLVEDVQKQVYKEFPEPQPPQQVVELLGTETVEKNFADPNYIAAHESWKKQVNEVSEDRTRKMLIKMGVSRFLEWDETRQAEVDTLRKEMAELGAPLEETDDRFVWISRIALGTVEDWTDFTTYLIRRNQPTEAAVAEHLRKF